MATTANITLHLATGNAHKVAEFNRMIAAMASDATSAETADVTTPTLPTGALASVRFLGAADIGGMPGVAEDTGTFEGNARQKAVALRARITDGAWVLADDSGLCCDALGGAPGVETANYAGLAAPAAAHRRKLLDALRGVPAGQRGARFECLLLLLAPDGAEHQFRGVCPGEILEEERGAGGFGYDPVFRAVGTACSFAELPPAEKDRLSHRGRAFRQLAFWLASRA